MSNLWFFFPVDPCRSRDPCADCRLANPKWKALPKCGIPLLTPSQCISVHKLKILIRYLPFCLLQVYKYIMWFSDLSGEGLSGERYLQRSCLSAAFAQECLLEIQISSYYFCRWLGTFCLRLWEEEWEQQGLQILLSGAVQGVGLLSSWLMAWE